ncbi:cupin domain-containing protein [Rhodococcus gannanensis]|uniref:Cupin domain-containing protein n=1 Tax=Rhodococcus gannanensis TaxID=1960308 RepID=A0ABW4NZY5_9NOCA
MADTGCPSEIHGLHGGRGVNRWKRFVTGLMLYAHWDSYEHNRLAPGAAVGEHIHTRTEEIYYIVAGHGRMTLNGETRDVGPGDLAMTPLNGRHSIENIGDVDLEFIVVEALPPSIVELLPAYRPSEVQA